ncbi:MAG: alpha-L-glutamate ligase [Deltaproteobacteria bacterium]|nr:MAG: alpha-L-glutamate ligase [Deltaproteobacteria bacterium]
MIHVLYENELWLPPLLDALAERKLPVRPHFLDGGVLDLAASWPAGVWINRMSPSSHTRNHQGGVTYTRELLAVLEARGHRILNGSRAFALELSKIQQDAALRAAGILTPHTIGVVAADAKAAARRLSPPFITKHNQGGKGLGVQLFRSYEAFDAHVDQGGIEHGSPDGVVILQQYIEPAEPYITRVEIVDGTFLYALRSSTEGGFELCPADACAVDDAFCPVGAGGKFGHDPTVTRDDPLVQRYIRFLDDNDIALAGIEYVTDAHGRRYTYDINGTTNFNSTVEDQAGVYGMRALAELAARTLAEVDQRLPAAK